MSSPELQRLADQIDRDQDRPFIQHGEIAMLAYTYWEERGRPIGDSEHDWFRAEEELRGQRSVPDDDSSAVHILEAAIDL